MERPLLWQPPLQHRAENPVDGRSCYPDFVSIAKGYNIPGRPVFRREDVEDAIREKLETNGLFLLDCHKGLRRTRASDDPAGQDLQRYYDGLMTEN